jgi:hypothetical protein
LIDKSLLSLLEVLISLMPVLSGTLVDRALLFDALKFLVILTVGEGCFKKSNKTFVYNDVGK